MTQNYQKLADDFVENWVDSHLPDLEEDIGYELRARHIQNLYDGLETLLKQVAEEARKDEREMILNIDSIIATQRETFLNLWEMNLSLCIKKKPRYLPKFIWKRLLNIVLVQSSEMEIK